MKLRLIYLWKYHTLAQQYKSAEWKENIGAVTME